MSLNIIEDARRELRAIVTLAEHNRLDPESFRTLTQRLAHRIDEIEIVLDSAGPVQERVVFQGPDGRPVGLPLCEVSFRGHLSVIEGGRP